MIKGIDGKKNHIRFTVDGLLESVLVILMILNCNSIYGRLATTTLHIEELTTVVMVLLLIIDTPRIIVKKKTFQFVVGVELLSFLYLAARYSYSDKSNFILQFIIFLPCMVLYLSQNHAKKEILSIYKKFSKFIIIISTLSSAVWFLAEIVHVITPNVTLNITWGTTHTVQGFYGLYFETQKENTFGIYMFRNTGIFCEAPMHSLVLTLALIYEMFLNKEINKIRIIILCLYIVTTFSLTGILCIVIAFLMKYWTRLHLKRRIIKFIYYAAFSGLIIAAIIASNILLSIKSGTGSYSLRMIDYIAGIRAWMDHPLFGIGYNSIGGLLKYQNDLIIDLGYNWRASGFSNSLTAILGQGGLCLSILYLFPFILIILGHKKAFTDIKMWSLMILILLSTTIFYARYIMFYFLAIAYLITFNFEKRKQK